MIKIKKNKKFSKAKKIFITLSILIIFIFFIQYKIEDKTNRIPIFKSYVAEIDIDGEIGGGDGFFSEETYDHQWTMNKIDKLIKDGNNKALIIRVDSPGGSVYTSDEIYHKILQYKKETKRPVFAYMGSMAASGGYYISAPCDKIIANRNCWTGSIGVTLGTMYDMSGLLDGLGIKTNTITSGRNKAMGSSSAPMTAEQKNIYQSLVDEAYDQFVSIVAKGRKMDEKRVREIADGRVLTAKQAKDLDLIDEILEEDKAMEKFTKKVGLDVDDLVYLAPENHTILTFLNSKIKNNSFNEAVKMLKNGDKFTLSYMANITK